MVCRHAHDLLPLQLRHSVAGEFAWSSTCAISRPKSARLCLSQYANIRAMYGTYASTTRSGWPPADVLLELRETGRFPRAFTEVRFRGPGLPVLIRHG